jgi:hypothetical protein
VLLLPVPVPLLLLLLLLLSCQGINLGVALPDWMFAKDKKAAPLMLLALVGGGILLPLGLMSWYMLSSSKFSGPNKIHNDTFLIFLHSKYNIKESQVGGLTRAGMPSCAVCGFPASSS